MDAYLSPCLKRYLASFLAGFDGDIESRCLFMQSDGGLAPVDAFSGFKAILSGPAGGVVGYAQTTYDTNTAVPVIGFDMGGTSTDVSRYDGTYHHVFETTTAGVTIQVPQLDITTVPYSSWNNDDLFRLLLEEEADSFIRMVCWSSVLNQPERIQVQLVIAKTVR